VWQSLPLPSDVLIQDLEPSTVLTPPLSATVTAMTDHKVRIVAKDEIFILFVSFVVILLLFCCYFVDNSVVVES
jgi:hypothetical protein